jgi:putative addiction module killer protein
VEARKRHVKNYLSPNGADCFQEWLRSVRDDRAKRAIRIRINRVYEGNFGDCRPVGEGVHELRIDIGQGYRVYFGSDGDDVILLGGSSKGNQDTQINTVKGRWEEYNA